MRKIQYSYDIEMISYIMREKINVEFAPKNESRLF